MNIYFGDIHNHCCITYGYGSLENAIIAAKEQLDFCCVTGHAMWPDIPPRREGLEFLVDFHKNGFAKLRTHWEEIREILKQANSNEFVTFQGYEMHSSYYGDHTVISPDDTLPLIDSKSPVDLFNNTAPCRRIVIPHHVGYTPGYRGVNWSEFNEDISPVVEVFSKHGCGMSDDAAYPYLHTMGPRDGRNTVFEGLRQGKKFGFIASTDHHAGYPGSYGDGRVAVLAEEKTRESIFDAILKRRTYAVTGDKMKCYFDINGRPMGSEIVTGDRNISIGVEACDYIDKVTIYKNLKPFKVYHEPVTKQESESYKVRIEMGWGGNQAGYDWKLSAEVGNGEIIDAEPCFRGRNVLAPSQGMQDNDNINKINNRLVKVTHKSIDLECRTIKNPSTLQSATCSVVLEIKGDADTKLFITVNGKNLAYTLGELLQTSYSTHMSDYNCEAVLVHRAVPSCCYKFAVNENDASSEKETDIYHVEVRQKNGQYAWVSPIFCKALSA